MRPRLDTRDDDDDDWARGFLSSPSPSPVSPSRTVTLHEVGIRLLRSMGVPHTHLSARSQFPSVPGLLNPAKLLYMLHASWTAPLFLPFWCRVDVSDIEGESARREESCPLTGNAAASLVSPIHVNYLIHRTWYCAPLPLVLLCVEEWIPKDLELESIPEGEYPEYKLISSTRHEIVLQCYQTKREFHFRFFPSVFGEAFAEWKKKHGKDRDGIRKGVLIFRRIHRILRNIIKQPDNMQIRSLKWTNRIIENELLCDEDTAIMFMKLLGFSIDEFESIRRFVLEPRVDRDLFVEVSSHFSPIFRGFLEIRSILMQCENLSRFCGLLATTEPLESLLGSNETDPDFHRVSVTLSDLAEQIGVFRMLAVYKPAKRSYEVILSDVRRQLLALSEFNSNPKEVLGLSSDESIEAIIIAARSIVLFLDDDSSRARAGRAVECFSDRFTENMRRVLGCDDIRLENRGIEHHLRTEACTQMISNWCTDLSSSNYRIAPLKNVGNSCYINSVLQLLYTVPEILKEILLLTPLSTETIIQMRAGDQEGTHVNAMRMILSLQSMFASMLFSPTASKTVEDPKFFVESLTYAREGFWDGQQQDVFEFMILLFEQFEQVFSLYPSRENILQKMFCFKYHQSTQWQDPNPGKSDMIICENCLMLSVRDHSSLEESLIEHFSPVLLEDFELPNGSRGQAVVRRSLEEISDNVLVFLKRVDHHGRVDSSLIFDQTLDLGPFFTESRRIKEIEAELLSMEYVSSPDAEKSPNVSGDDAFHIFELDRERSELEASLNQKGSTVLELTHMILHDGNLHFGHYWIYLRFPGRNEWYKMNDSFSEQTSWDHVLNDGIGGEDNRFVSVVLLYRRRNSA